MDFSGYNYGKSDLCHLETVASSDWQQHSHSTATIHK